MLPILEDISCERTITVTSPHLIRLISHQQCLKPTNKIKPFMRINVNLSSGPSFYTVDHKNVPLFYFNYHHHHQLTFSEWPKYLTLLQGPLWHVLSDCYAFCTSENTNKYSTI